MESTTNNNARVAIMDKLDEADQHFRISHNDVCHLLMDRIQLLQCMFRIPTEQLDALSTNTVVPMDQIQHIESAQLEQREVLNQLSRRLSARHGRRDNYFPSNHDTQLSQPQGETITNESVDDRISETMKSRIVPYTT